MNHYQQSVRMVKALMEQNREKMSQIKTACNQLLREKGHNLIFNEVLKAGEERVVHLVSLPPGPAEVISAQASFEKSRLDTLSRANARTSEVGRYLDVEAGAKSEDHEIEPKSGENRDPRDYCTGGVNEWTC